MNSYEKIANDLVDKLCSKAGIYTEQGKECAIVLIEEIQKEIKENFNICKGHDNTIYWEYVKEEVKKINH